MYDLVSRTNRRDDLVYSTHNNIVSSYTLDMNYVTSYQVWYGDTKVYRKIQPLGSVVALNPETRKVVPNFTSYGFSALGILAEDAMVEFGDKEVDVIFAATVNEKAVWDNGEYQNVLQATRDILADRIHFVNIDKMDDVW